MESSERRGWRKKPPKRGTPTAHRSFVPLVGLAALIIVLGVALFRLRPTPRPNLLLITIDTLRADHVGAYGYSLASTATLDSLARSGARFEWAESAVPLTGPSHSTILTGLYPPMHGVRDNVTFVLDASHVTLATLLRRAGYHTGAFVGAYPVAASLGFSQGFDDFEEGFHEIPVAGEGAERPANEVANSVISWLSKTKEPFFVWMHVYDPHAPYRPPSPYRETFREHPYDGEIAFADAQIGRVVEAIRASGREKRTLVAALGDHGESLGEHGEATHALLIYESTLRIPLVMSGPGVPEGRVVSDRVGTVDVLPTLMGLVGIQPPPGLPGRDLRPLFLGRRLPRGAQYSESLFGRLNCRWSSLRSWTEGDWKLINGAEPELYDLSEDPGETRNRAQNEHERTRKMAQALGEALARMAPGGDGVRARAVAPEQQERLRSLGYTGGGTGGAGSLDEAGLPDPRQRVHLYETLQGLLASPPEMSARAADTAAQAAALDPGNPLAFFTIASLAYHAGQFRRADRAFLRCLALDPERPTIRAYRAQLLRDMGRLEESEKELRVTLEQTTPDDLRTRISLAETLTAAHKFDEADHLLTEVLSQAPHHIEALGAKGRLLLAEGRGKDAIPALEEACRGDHVEAWAELASAQLSLGNAAGAHEAADRALALSPQHPWALAVAGHALLLEGRSAEGVELLHRALAAGPRRPRVWRSLAQAFAAAGDRDASARCSRAAETSVSG
jgi:choline-sulfatase